MDVAGGDAHNFAASSRQLITALIVQAAQAAWQNEISGELVMADNKPTVDVTKDWQANQGQKSSANRLRIYAMISWLIAIGGEVYGFVMLRGGKFVQDNLPMIIALLVGIAIFAIAGNFLWKAANKKDPAKKSDAGQFFFQNQLGAIITLIAFVPLVLLILTDKNMDPQTKKVAGGLGAVLAVIAAMTGVSIKPPSVEQYTQDMNECATQIKSGQPTTACSPEVASQAQEIAADTATITEATKSAANPNGQDVVYWIAPDAGQTKSDHELVFHLCPEVSPLKDKTVNHGSVTEAYAQNAIRITKQISMEQKQCGFTTAAAAPAMAPAAPAN
jgi:hypothetical protein